MNFRCFKRTDVGRVRSDNEDFIAWDQALELAVLADGMGGLNAGEVASEQAVAQVLETVRGQASDRDQPAPAEQTVKAAIGEANHRVLTLAQARSDQVGMGTTLVVWWALSDASRCVIGSVGDSRAYRWRKQELKQLTTDHSVVQQLLDQGLITEAEARSAPNRNVITRAVGIEADVECDTFIEPIVPGDLFLLCSDGVTDMLTDLELAELLAGIDDPAALPDAIVAAANRRGGNDNISVVLIAA